MYLRWPWLLAPLSMVAGCGLLGEADVSALPRIEAGLDATDAADAADVLDATDAVTDDGADIDRPDAMDAMDVRDAADAGDIVDAADASDIVVAADARDVFDVRDADDVLDARDADEPRDVPDVRDTGDATVLPICPVARLVAPISNSVATDARLRFSWMTAPSVTRFVVTVCRRRACEASDLVWMGAPPVPPMPAVVNAPVPTMDVSRLRPGVYWWKVESVDSRCRTASSPVWEFRVAAPVVPPAGMMGSTEATWWGAYADFNGDGYADLAAGAPALAVMPTEPGQVLVRFGDSSAILRSGGMRLQGMQRRFGAHVSSGGDVNGDGFGDLLVTSNDGVQTFEGRAEGISETGTPWRTFPTGATEVRAEGVGDVNGDGFGDIVARALVAGTEHVYFGAGAVGVGARTLTEIHPLVDSDMARPCNHFGASVAPAGDVNGDRYADFIIGCPMRLPGEVSIAMTGARAFVVFGGPGFNPAMPSFVPLRPPNPMHTGFGHLVANLGDLQGVGRSVVAVANEAESSRFQVFAFPLTTVTTGITPMPIPVPRGFESGLTDPLSALVSVGDVNGDGRGDFALASSDILSSTISVGVSGQAPPTSRPMLGERTIALAGAGDFNGDGFDDIAVGVRLPLSGGLLNPVVQVTTGRTMPLAILAPDSEATVFRDAEGRALFGFSLAAGR